MLWDGLIVIMAVVLAVNGWNRGLIRSWRGPIAMILATVIVQRIYIDFSTWVMSRLRIDPDAAVIIGYLMLWFSVEVVLEIALSMLIRDGVQKRPVIVDRLGGVFYGLAKAAVIVILPLMAISVDLKIPPPPKDKSGLVLPDSSTAKGSLLLPGFESVAEAAIPIAGNLVVSNNAPSFTPTYPRLKGDEEEVEESKPAVDRKEIEDLLK
jgi:uncharacterized membrane protein required for colicin V production